VTIHAHLPAGRGNSASSPEGGARHVRCRNGPPHQLREEHLRAVQRRPGRVGGDPRVPHGRVLPELHRPTSVPRQDSCLGPRRVRRQGGTPDPRGGALAGARLALTNFVLSSVPSRPTPWPSSPFPKAPVTRMIDPDARCSGKARSPAILEPSSMLGSFVEMHRRGLPGGVLASLTLPHRTRLCSSRTSTSSSPTMTTRERTGSGGGTSATPAWRSLLSLVPVYRGLTLTKARGGATVSLWHDNFAPVKVNIFFWNLDPATWAHAHPRGPPRPRLRRHGQVSAPPALPRSRTRTTSSSPARAWRRSGAVS
jgi:hypothetical protein